MVRNTTDTTGVQVVPTEPGEVVLRPRNVQFDTSHTPLHWIPNEPIVSHFISAFNLLLPEGERAFVDTFTRALPYVKTTRSAKP
ncbi:metal-dependent hydrolase [Mycobacteroides abscessus]|nr:metal-dependent hydrolase [Mycobacteroides abscessus]